MQEFPATEAKDKWGIMTDAALREPISITRYGRPAFIMTTYKDYEELQRLRYQKFKADVQAGFQSLERGEYGKLTIEEIKAEGRRRLEAIENNVPG